jgi:nitronate monooxygenase
MAAGYDPAAMKKGDVEISLGRPEENVKRWRDVWAAGHGVGEVHAIEPMRAIIDALVADYAATGA